MKSLLFSLLLCLAIRSTIAWKLSLPSSSFIVTSSSSSSSSVYQTMPVSSISPSVLSMIKNDRLSLHINANLMFTNLVLAHTKPHRSTSSLLLAMSQSMRSKDSINTVLENVKRIFTITSPIQLIKNGLISLILFIKIKFGIKDQNVEKKEMINSSQDKDIKDAKRWTSQKIREIELREVSLNIKSDPTSKPRTDTTVVKDSVYTRKYSITESKPRIDGSTQVRDIASTRKNPIGNNMKPSSQKRSYSLNITDADKEKFWPPNRLFNMTNGGGEQRLVRQSVPLLVPNPTIKIENDESKIQSLASEIKALSKEPEEVQSVPLTVPDFIKIENDELTIQSLDIKALSQEVEEVSMSKENEVIDPIAALGALQSNITNNVQNVSSEMVLNNTLGIWKLEENRILHGLETGILNEQKMIDRIILQEREQIFSELSGSKGLSWSHNKTDTVGLGFEMKILRGTSTTDYVRDNGKLISVKVTRPPANSFHQRPTLVVYRGFSIGDRIIGDVYTSSYAMGNIPTLAEETLAGKFQLQRYTDEEMGKEKKAMEVEQNLRYWGNQKIVNNLI